MEIVLNRNLRRDLLRGNPWLYKEAVLPSKKTNVAQIAAVYDQKKIFIGWGIYDPNSALACRMLSLQKQKPNESYLKNKLALAIQKRSFILDDHTNCCRLVNGEGDELPGLIIDAYNDILVLQFDGQNLQDFWLNYPIADWLNSILTVKAIFIKHRRSENTLQNLLNNNTSPDVLVKENDAIFKVDLEKGQKTGFFFDQRDNRLYVRQLAKDLTVLNLFSYTGGFSVYAGLGGARCVTSIDIAPGAVAASDENWKLNNLPSDNHHAICQDVFTYLQDSRDSFDLIIVDPPSMAPSEKTKEFAIKKYAEAFSLAAKKVKPGGQLVLSSCSSHISFNDFFSIVTESLSASRRRGQYLRISGQGPDHPFVHSLMEMRYLKFVHLYLD